MSAPKPRVLIVAEAEADAAALNRLLEADYQVLQASEAQALAVVEAEDAELVLLSFDAKGLALELCRNLKANPALASRPVILIGAPEDEAAELQAITAGVADFLPSPLRPTSAMARIKVHLENRRYRNILQDLTWLDAVTGIPNREKFEEAMEAEWRRNSRNRTPISLLLMEVDHYQNFCEEHGNQAGNETLRRMIGALTSGIQRAGDVVGRFNEQVFACLLPETDTLGAVSVGERIRAEMNSMAIPHGRSEAAPYVTLSLGVASLVPGRNDLLDDLQESAEEALAKARQRGGNQVVFG
ncbi:MAG: diguanylate cyclase [Holophaga sp.]|nr:diguanylate cyclase [Holophaga sp.]